MNTITRCRIKPRTSWDGFVMRCLLWSHLKQGKTPAAARAAALAEFNAPLPF
jgi:hypothetical protein